MVEDHGEWPVFGNALGAGEMSDEAFLSYLFAYQICNERFETFFREALRGQEASCLRAPATSLDQGSRPGGLRLQFTDHDPHDLEGNALALEVVGDQQIAGTPAREQGCPTCGESPVVDQPRPLHHFERLPPHGTRGAAVCESLLERGRGVVAGPERTHDLGLRLETP